MHIEDKNSKFENELKTATFLIWLGLIPYLGLLILLFSVAGLVRAKTKASNKNDNKRVNLRFLIVFLLIGVHIAIRILINMSASS